MTDMGPKIKSLRLAKGLYQQDLARILNVTKGAVGMWETNKRVPDIETIGKIADFFGVSVDWLTGASEYKNPVGVNDYSWGTVGDFEFAVGFVSLLKKIRHSLGVSDFQMGRVIGFNPSQYLAAEDGEIPITRRQAEMLCKKLGTNVSQVLFDNELYDEYVPEEYHNDVRKWGNNEKV